MTDLEKAKILYECHIRMFGNGHFDLSIEDAAEVLRLIRTKRKPETLRKSLADFYENHPAKKDIDAYFEEQNKRFQL